MNSTIGFQVLAFLNLGIILAFIAMGIYGFVLFVKLARRGIKALDIYIAEKTNKTSS